MTPLLLLVRTVATPRPAVTGNARDSAALPGTDTFQSKTPPTDDRVAARGHRCALYAHHPSTRGPIVGPRRHTAVAPDGQFFAPDRRSLPSGDPPPNPSLQRTPPG